MGNALVKLAVNLTELPVTSIAVVGKVLVAMTGAPRTLPPSTVPKMPTRKPCMNLLFFKCCIIVKNLDPPARKDFTLA